MSRFVELGAVGVGSSVVVGDSKGEDGKVNRGSNTGKTVLTDLAAGAVVEHQRLRLVGQSHPT